MQERLDIEVQEERNPALEYPGNGPPAHEIIVGYRAWSAFGARVYE